MSACWSDDEWYCDWCGEVLPVAPFEDPDQPCRKFCSERCRDGSAHPCEVEGIDVDTYGGEREWRCGAPGTITVGGKLMCEDHAGERGYGPKLEEYGYDPDDSPESTPTAPEPGKEG